MKYKLLTDKLELIYEMNNELKQTTNFHIPIDHQILQRRECSLNINKKQHFKLFEQ